MAFPDTEESYYASALSGGPAPVSVGAPATLPASRICNKDVSLVLAEDSEPLPAGCKLFVTLGAGRGATSIEAQLRGAVDAPVRAGEALAVSGVQLCDVEGMDCVVLRAERPDGGGAGVGSFLPASLIVNRTNKFVFGGFDSA